MDVVNVINERGENYGNFADGATIMQKFKDVAHSHHNFAFMSPDKREAVDMILHKLGRIINGNPEYLDNWVDIQGYAKLIEQTLESKNV